jgi:UDP-N-acetylglucosamine transferase subunit ALG13
VKYLGMLSRLEKKEIAEVKDQLLIVLSGPEPQRSLFEDNIINEISHYPGRATIVRGLPLSLSVIPSSGMIKFYNHLPATELGNEMEKAEWVISRCGYSTIMDIVKMQKKSILVPTPGQTEQEYLAKNLQQTKIAYCIDQKEFSMTTALAVAKKFDYHIPSVHSSEQIKTIITGFLAQLHFTY